MGYLSDVARRRIAALLLLAGAVVAALAITDTGPFEDPPTEEERAREAVERFYGAAADGDFETYCTMLTERAREQVQRNAARLLDEDGKLNCVDILSVAEESFAGARLRVLEVSVSGPRARVEANLKVPNAPLDARTMFLELEDGRWLVSDPG